MNAVAKDSREIFRLGLSCWKHQIFGGALSYFQKAHQIHPDDPTIKSYLGMTMVKEDVRKRGIELCQEAVRANPFHDDLVFNLGQAYLWTGNRAEARKTFIHGMKRCENSQRFIKALREMGMRRKPVVPFLSRNNCLNRWLGKMTYRPGNFQCHDLK